MRKDFEVNINGANTFAILEQREDNLWFCEADSMSCVAVDPRTALVGAFGYGEGQVIYESLNNGGGELNGFR